MFIIRPAARKRHQQGRPVTYPRGCGLPIQRPSRPITALQDRYAVTRTPDMNALTRRCREENIRHCLSRRQPRDPASTGPRPSRLKTRLPCPTSRRCPPPSAWSPLPPPAARGIATGWMIAGLYPIGRLAQWATCTTPQSVYSVQALKRPGTASEAHPGPRRGGPCGQTTLAL